MHSRMSMRMSAGQSPGTSGSASFPRVGTRPVQISQSTTPNEYTSTYDGETIKVTRWPGQ